MRSLFPLLALSALSAVSSAQEFTDLLWSQRGFEREVFGRGLATDGARLVVGADTCKPGAVYVYRRSGLTWLQEARLVNRKWSEAADWDGYGQAVDVDGDRVVASADFFQGTLYVFDRGADGKWTRTDIPAPDPFNEEGFGEQVELEGDTIVAMTYVGFPHSSVYVLERRAGTWEVTKRFLDAKARQIDFDGQRIAMGTDSGTLVYRRDGADWALEFSLPAARNAAVAIEGDTLVLSGRQAFYHFDGATWQNEPGVDVFSGEIELAGDVCYMGLFSGQGQVAVCERANGAWSLKRTLLPSPLENLGNAGFGQAVAAHGDLLVVAAPGYNSDGYQMGAVLSYSRAGERATLTGTPIHLSLIDGGTQTLTLDAGVDFAGLPYVFAGSLTGTSPGFQLGRSWIPLHARDPYFPVSVRLGVLDGLGRATQAVSVPPLSLSALNHHSLHHAFAVFDPPHGIVHISNVALAALVNAHL